MISLKNMMIEYKNKSYTLNSIHKQFFEINIKGQTSFISLFQKERRAQLYLTDMSLIGLGKGSVVEQTGKANQPSLSDPLPLLDLNLLIQISHCQALSSFISLVSLTTLFLSPYILFVYAIYDSLHSAEINRI